MESNKVTIHQPEHLPWTGFFHKMALADTYVLLDSVQFTKNNWQNRNRLIDNQGNIFWATVPVRLEGHINSTIADVEISSDVPAWRKKYWARLEQAYSKTPFYRQYEEELHEILFTEYIKLVDLNCRLIDFFRKELGINNRILRSSELSPEGKRSTLLLDICKKLNATVYLSGPSGRDYLEKEIFAEAGIALEYHEFHPPVYTAKFYEPGLSTLDILMNHGKDAAVLIGIQR